MTSQRGFLIDRSLAKVAAVDVAFENDFYSGSICLDATPPHILRIFEELEEAVEAQMFSLADEIEEKIDALSLKVVFANGMEAGAEDLQVFPSTNRISFKLGQASAAAK